MKKLVKLVVALFSAGIFSAAQSQTVTDTDVTITGQYPAACSITGNNIALGSAALHSYIEASLPSQAHTRYPMNLGVTCNAAVPWRLFNINPAGVPISIGSETGNKACIASSTQAHDGYRKCADNTAVEYHGGAHITGTGSSTVPVTLVIWYNVGAVQLPWVGSGNINTVIPMRMEY